jgi:hypothetical protein
MNIFGWIVIYSMVIIAVVLMNLPWLIAFGVIK